MNSEMNKTLEENRRLYEQDTLNYETYYDKKIQMATTWAQTSLGSLMDENDLSARLALIRE
jgi:hypothetical protein